MSLELGQILDGKVTGLTKFGAFVELADGISGMVHISEIASTFVKEINDFLTVGQEVKVKVINIDEAGKIGLSIKQAEPNFDNQEKASRSRGEQRPAPKVWDGPKNKNTDDTNLSFEEMMSKWKTSSDEKMSDLRRSAENKRSGGGGYNRRSGARRS
ncbi:MAG: S1 RNA-binding domain-containing protein [Ruminococcaceae bacterium]|nr:S1 RNA-binding domain-containing protein [Oscillospiraceae bacterium]